MVSLHSIILYLVPAARGVIDFDVGLVEGVQRIVAWRRPEPQPTQAEIDAAAPAAEAAYQAELAAKAAANADKADLKAQFATDKAKLDAIIDAVSFTNAQRDAALKDLAQVQRRLLKAVKGMVL